MLFFAPTLHHILCFSSTQKHTNYSGNLRLYAHSTTVNHCASIFFSSRPAFARVCAFTLPNHHSLLVYRTIPSLISAFMFTAASLGQRELINLCLLFAVNRVYNIATTLPAVCDWLLFCLFVLPKREICVDQSVIFVCTCWKASTTSFFCCVFCFPVSSKQNSFPCPKTMQNHLSLRLVLLATCMHAALHTHLHRFMFCLFILTRCPPGQSLR